MLCNLHHLMTWSSVNLSLAATVALLELGDAFAAICPNALLSRTNLLQFVEDGTVRPVRSEAQWQYRRRAILDAMEEVMGPMPGQSKRCPLDPVVEEEADCGSYLRRLVSY